MSRPTINDIARQLNLTPSTVSRALSGNNRVSEKTREMVERKAIELGYERNALASSLRRGVSDTVGMIVPRINRQFFSNVISGVEAILNPVGLHLIICQSHEHSEDERRAIQTLMRNQVCGIIISHALDTRDSKHVEEIATAGLTLVQFDRVFPGVGGVCLTNDNLTGAFQATTHLINGGYKRIGYLGGDEQSNVYKDRREGYKKALTEAGIQIDESIMFADSITRDKGFYNMSRALLAGCDALYCSGDYGALGAIEYARLNKISIPDDFGIVGTANENFAELLAPSLTSLEQNAFEMGNKVAEAFLKLRNNEPVGESNIVLPMRLLIRESSVRSMI